MKTWGDWRELTWWTCPWATQPFVAMPPNEPIYYDKPKAGDGE